MLIQNGTLQNGTIHKTVCFKTVGYVTDGYNMVRLKTVCYKTEHRYERYVVQKCTLPNETIYKTAHFNKRYIATIRYSVKKCYTAEQYIS